MEAFDNLAPLYAQVKQRLRARIETGALTEGAFLPTEPELCAEMGVSRITVRRAVSELCEEGLLARQQGRGTVVARKKVEQALVSLSGFSEAFKGEGEVSHDVLSVTEGAGGSTARAALGTRAPLLIKRLICLNDRPFTLEYLFLDPERLGQVVAPVRGGASLFQTLREFGGPEPVSAHRLINVGFASAAERKHLRIGSTQPVYRIDKTVWGAEDQAIAFSNLVTPTHLISFSLRT